MVWFFGDEEDVLIKVPKDEEIVDHPDYIKNKASIHPGCRSNGPFLLILVVSPSGDFIDHIASDGEEGDQLKLSLFLAFLVVLNGLEVVKLMGHGDKDEQPDKDGGWEINQDGEDPLESGILDESGEEDVFVEIELEAVPSLSFDLCCIDKPLPRLISFYSILIDYLHYILYTII